MLTKRLIPLAIVACAAVAGAQLGLAAEAAVSEEITAAVASPERPQADRDRDAARKPAEVIAFAGIEPGDKVLEFLPGGGYFTRIFSGVVGPSGHVYAVSPRESEAVAALAKSNPNVSFAVQPVEQLKLSEPVDVVWTSLNYHDVANRQGTAALNQAAFQALEPGGTYIVIDHVAAPGAPADVTSKLHRIDPERVKKEVQAAGFELAGESDVLRNPDDPRSASPHDASIRGRTDQFVLKFRKPAR